MCQINTLSIVRALAYALYVRVLAHVTGMPCMCAFWQTEKSAFWRFIRAHSAFWRFIRAHSAFWRFIRAHSAFWRFIRAHSAFWTFIRAHSAFWRFDHPNESNINIEFSDLMTAQKYEYKYARLSFLLSALRT